MKTRNTFRLLLLAAALLLAAGSALSQVRVGLEVRFGPPAPRYEAVGPAPFHHAVWVRGHWAWDAYDGRYEWVRGSWIAARPAYAWSDGGWYRTPRGWAWREGSWQHRGARQEAFGRDNRNDRHDRYADRDNHDRGDGRDDRGGRGRSDR